MYVIRSLIDYASLVLVQFNSQQLRCLEVIQNKAMRIILGCASTTKIEVLRRELSLPSVVKRIEEITCRTVCRIVCNGTNSLQRDIMTLCNGDDVTSNPYLRKICRVLQNFDVMDEFKVLIKRNCCTA